MVLVFFKKIMYNNKCKVKLTNTKNRLERTNKMKELLNRWIENLNKAFDKREVEQSGENATFCFTYWDGKINAYIDTIIDLAEEIGVETDINPINGHMYIK